MWMLVVFAVLLVIRKITNLLNAPSPWLDWDQLPPPRPLETNLKRRNVVIAQRFKPELVTGKSWDAVIIGSGIGGLSTAALLSRTGWRVLVLEQHEQAGGGAHVYQEKGFEFDTGIHYVGNMLGNSELRAYFDQISDGQLQWCPMNREYDEVHLGTPGTDERQYRIRSGSWVETEAHLMDLFPHETEAIAKFTKDVRVLDHFRFENNAKRSYLSAYGIKTLLPRLFSFLSTTGILHLSTSLFRYSRLSVQVELSAGASYAKAIQRDLQEQIESLTSNKDLQAVLAYIVADYGCAPGEAPWAMQGVLWDHLRTGPAYPYGGPSQIAHSIIPVIRKAGGQVLCSARVSEICVSKGSVQGVEVKWKSGQVFIPATRVISDAGLINTFTRLVPPCVAKNSEYTQLAREIGSGRPANILFVGLRGSAKELGLEARNYFFFTNSDVNKSLYAATEYSKLTQMSDPDQAPPFFFACFPSAKDSSWESRYPDRSTAIIISPSLWTWFSDYEGSTIKKRQSDYESEKALHIECLWTSFLRHFPHLEGRDEMKQLASPLTAAHYLSAPKGELYGLNHALPRWSPEAFGRLRPRTDIPGLWLTGQDVFTCGLAGAAYGGLSCAADLLGRGLFYDLIQLRIERKNFPKE